MVRCTGWRRSGVGAADVWVWLYLYLYLYLLYFTLSLGFVRLECAFDIDMPNSFLLRRDDRSY
ncbi:predicted protein [Plenodomus lingam JN3]|uniref:Uncharacterized protein n=1 Tax=Leptosphaeria maculans (strain JN3 / isolate v23.1.3 / race Av1-4-5-6-7-8) TaxID=985895 RepID=E4ZGH2_LEPMJ|nr:predicted protein [Plenodomus lingam JN3]CBX90392.1 predicted protein [Plenodomus lingam JN3]